MFCTNCGKIIGDDSKFCQFCGTSTGSKKDNDKKEEPEKNNTALDILWEKFAEVYNAKDAEKKKYLDNSSNEAWELINRLYTNNFESIIEEYKEILNKQPYKVLEIIKLNYQLSVIGGYWFSVSESLLHKKELGKLKPIELEKFIEEWKNTALDNFSQTTKNFSEELMLGFNQFHNIRIEAIFEEAPSLKELPNEFIEKLKSNLVMLIFWGYIIGQNEAAYRK